jgi:hypothetical protein
VLLLNVIEILIKLKLFQVLWSFSLKVPFLMMTFVIQFGVKYNPFPRLFLCSKAFHYWLPLLLNHAHAQVALPLIKASLVSMKNNVPFDIKKYLTFSRYDPYGRFILPNLTKKEREEVVEPL